MTIEKCGWTFWAHDVEGRNLILRLIRDQILDFTETRKDSRDDCVHVKVEITRGRPDAE